MKKNDIEDPITIQAEFIRESVNSGFYNCEGDFKWFPKSQIHFDPEKSELTAPKWLMKKQFPNEQF